LPGGPAIYLGLALFTIVARAGAWPVALIDPDEYAFILAGREVLHGHLPYTTMFDIKPVGASLLLALAMKLGGATVLAVRVAGAVCVFATAVLLHETARLLSAGSRQAIGAGILYIAFSVLFHGLATMTEIMLAPFSAAGVLLLVRWCAARGAGRTPLVCGAGLAFGIAVCIKLVPCIPAFAVALSAGIVAMAARRIGPIRLILQGVLFAACVALPMAASAGVFLQEHKLDEWMLSNFGFIGLYNPRLPFHVAVTKAINALVEMWPLVLAGLVGLSLRPPARQPSGASAVRAVPGIWLAAELLAVIMPGQVFPHYFLQALPPLCLLAARGLDVAADRLAPASSPLFRILLAGTVLVPLLPATWNDSVKMARADPLRQSATWLQQHISAARPSLLVLSFDLMPEYLFTGAPLPARVAIPLHLFGAQRALGHAAGGDALGNILARNADFIVMDHASVFMDISPEEQTEIESKLAACYQDAARFSQAQEIEPRLFSMQDIVVFVRRPVCGS